MPLPSIPENANARQLGDVLSQAADELANIRAIPADERSDDTVAEARDLRNFILDVDAMHQARHTAELASRKPQSNGPEAGFDTGGSDTRSIGQMLVESEDYQSFARNSQAATGSRQIHFERALLSTGDTTGSNLFIPVQQPKHLPTINRRLFLRSLLAHATTTGNGFPYMQEKAVETTELGANVTAEGDAKNEVSLEFEQKDAPVRKITAWIAMTTEIIEDAPLLRSYVDNRLLWMLALREELQFLNGAGTGVQLLGIRNQTGLQTQDVVVSNGAPDLPAVIGKSIAKVENKDGEADGVAINPLTFWNAVVQRHSATFDNSGSGNAPSAVANVSWGLNTVRTRALEPTAVLVGAFHQGATVVDRSTATVEVGNQHADFFITNKVAIRAEERVALPVERPYLFVEASLEIDPEEPEV